MTGQFPVVPRFFGGEVLGRLDLDRNLVVRGQTFHEPGHGIRRDANRHIFFAVAKVGVRPAAGALELDRRAATVKPRVHASYTLKGTRLSPDPLRSSQ